MKKWAFSGILLLLILVITVVYQIFHSNHVYLAQGNQKAISAAKKYTAIQSVKNVTFYHGTASYHVVNAELKNHKNVYLWVPDNSKKQIIEKTVKSGLSKQQAYNKIKQLNYSVQRVTDIKLGIIDQTPVWEVVFVDPSEQYNYVYLDFITGKEVEHILHI